MKKLFIATISTCIIFHYSIAQNSLPIIPKPAQKNLITKGPSFKLDNNTIICYNNVALEKNVLYLQHQLQERFGVQLKTKFAKDVTSIKGNNINIQMGPSNWQSGKGGEYYNIHALANNAAITVQEPIGLFYSIQSVLQCIKKVNANQFEIPAMSFSDYPRFGYRGMHLDVARHFMPIEVIKSYIDYLALYKFNTFHWHLTDDQGWRIEIKKYPLLTQIGGFRNGTIIGAYPGIGNDSTVHGGFYTQAQVKEIVQYASDRYITVIPEIEMPGHASAAIAAYPLLSCFPEQDTQHPAECAWAGNTTGKQVQQTWGVFEDVFCPSDYTFNFLYDVIDEVMELFPAKYIHIGGDECPKEAWKKSAFCQQLIASKQLKDEHGLQSYFIQTIEQYINKKGKQIIGWDEILEGGLAPNATVMSWRGEDGGIEAAKQHHQVIMTPGSTCYFDHSQSKNEDSVTIGGYLPIEMVYNYEPIPKNLSKDEAQYILGAQANVWTEYIKNKEKLTYMLFPRMAALAEVLWTPKELKSWPDFEKRLPTHIQLYNNQHINYSNAYYALEQTVLPTKDNTGVQWQLRTKLNRPIFYTQNNKSKPYNKPILINQSGTYYAHASDKGSNQTSQTFLFNKATGKKIILLTSPSKNYPGSGAFTLVNGIQNTKGFVQSNEFIGFDGTDCTAVIDLGKTNSISTITVHALSRKVSWIWPPSNITCLGSIDGIHYTTIGSTSALTTSSNGNCTLQIQVAPTAVRYIKCVIANWGTIPLGEAGAGNKPWLFVDEIEAN